MPNEETNTHQHKTRYRRRITAFFAWLFSAAAWAGALILWIKGFFPVTGAVGAVSVTGAVGAGLLFGGFFLAGIMMCWHFFQEANARYPKTDPGSYGMDGVENKSRLPKANTIKRNGLKFLGTLSLLSSMSVLCFVIIALAKNAASFSAVSSMLSTLSWFPPFAAGLGILFAIYEAGTAAVDMAEHRITMLAGISRITVSLLLIGLTVFCMLQPPVLPVIAAGVGLAVLGMVARAVMGGKPDEGEIDGKKMLRRDLGARSTGNSQQHGVSARRPRGVAGFKRQQQPIVDPAQQAGTGQKPTRRIQPEAPLASRGGLPVAQSGQMRTAASDARVKPGRHGRNPSSVAVKRPADTAFYPPAAGAQLPQSDTARDDTLPQAGRGDGRRSPVESTAM